MTRRTRRKIRHKVIIHPAVDGLIVSMDPVMGDIFYRRFTTEYHLQLHGSKKPFAVSLMSIVQGVAASHEVKYYITSKEQYLCGLVLAFIEKLAVKYDRVVENDRIIISRNHVQNLENNQTKLEREISDLKAKLEKETAKATRLREKTTPKRR